MDEKERYAVAELLPSQAAATAQLEQLRSAATIDCYTHKPGRPRHTLGPLPPGRALTARRKAVGSAG
jgi:hypothetical protein